MKKYITAILLTLGSITVTNAGQYPDLDTQYIGEYTITEVSFNKGVSWKQIPQRDGRQIDMSYQISASCDLAREEDILYKTIESSTFDGYDCVNITFVNMTSYYTRNPETIVSLGEDKFMVIFYKVKNGALVEIKRVNCFKIPEY